METELDDRRRGEHGRRRARVAQDPDRGEGERYRRDQDLECEGATPGEDVDELVIGPEHRGGSRFVGARSDVQEPRDRAKSSGPCPFCCAWHLSPRVGVEV
jgi:hypothetical protein